MSSTEKIIVYVSKKNCWYDEGTICILIEDYRNDKINPVNCGLFFGLKTCRNSQFESKPLGKKYFDEEVCSFDEFDIVELEK